jgi:hypothetical protein
MRGPLSPRALLVATWGVAGVLALLGQALARLVPYAVAALSGGLDALEWAIVAGWVLVNAYAEGYRGFQRGFSPRVVARALWLGEHPKPLWVVLAPIFCMAMFHAKKRRLVTSWSLFVGIVLLVTVVRLLPQPWRGIVDAGVVVGLGWGAVSLAVLYLIAVVRGRAPADDSLP